MKQEHLILVPHVDKSRKLNDHGITVKYKGEECRVVDYKGALAQRANGLNLILQDLESSLQFAKYPQSKSPTLQAALHRALVITYGKCFSQASHRKVQLDAKQVFKGAGEKLWRHHQSLIANRNEFVAHSGSDDYESSHVKVVLPPEMETELQSCILHAARSFRGYEPQSIKAVISTIEHAINYTNGKLKEVGDLIRAEVEQKEKNHLAK